MSPGSYMPISSTATSSAGASLQQRQRQADLVVLVGRCCAAPASARESNSAVCSLVEVLASEPVTPTTSGSKRLRHAAAASAQSGSHRRHGRRSTSPSLSSAAGRPRTTSATQRRRPATAASARKRWPSVRSPGRAKKTLPGATRRESTAAPRIGREPVRSSSPPTAVVSDWARRTRRRRSSARHQPRLAILASADYAPPQAGGRRRADRALRSAAERSRGREGRGGGLLVAGQRREVEHRDGVQRDAPEELVRRHLERHAPLLLDLRLGVVDAHEDDRLGPLGADEADEGVVVGVVQPRARLGVPDLCRARLAADHVAVDLRLLGVVRPLVDHVDHQLAAGSPRDRAR